MSTPRLHVVPDPGLGNNAYVLDLGDGRALVVDASRDLRAVDATLARVGLRAAFAADTHLHADFVTGSLDLARRDGATLLASAAGHRAYPHDGLRDGDEVDLGGLRLRALLTPGHTDEHVAFELVDGVRSVGVFTGGSLIVGAAARTDLVDPGRVEELARAQYRSLHRLASLPDDVAVWPTHGGGSFCSVPSGGEPTSTIGYERATNSLLSAPDEDSFVRELLDSLGTHPPYFARLSEVNRRGPQPPAGRELPALGFEQVRQAMATGVEVVDVRPFADFAAGHVPGSVSIPLRPVFATWLGWLVGDGTPVVVVRDDDQDLEEVWWQASKIGFDHLVGELAGGVPAWRAAGLATGSVPVLAPGEVGSRTVVDVRQANEFVAGHVPGAVHVELGTLAGTAGAALPGLDSDQPLLVMCGHGERAMGAASLLARSGHRQVAVLDGGPEDLVVPTAEGSHPMSGDLGPGGVVRLGLRQNLPQFVLLVAVNALVGGMLGQERTVLPLLAGDEFGLETYSAALTYILAFGLSKAVTNYFAGTWSDRYGRKSVLVAGWIVAVPVPVLLIVAPSWGVVILANVLLGISQGLTWSTTVIMKIDLVGPANRGLAMGLNEAAGYVAVAAAALATGYLADAYGLRPAPFLLGLAFAAIGLALSSTVVKETRHHAHLEASHHADQSGVSDREVLVLTSIREPALSSASQAGLVNNLNDGLAWGLFPILFASSGQSVKAVGVLTALYPAVWGAGQLVTGALSDRWGRKWLIVAGMLTQAAALGMVAAADDFAAWAVAAVLLGAGTAMVYPTLLATIGDVAHPAWRARSVGVYRLWRDGGFAVGALLAGLVADAYGIRAAIWVGAALTAASGVLVAVRMYETHPRVARRGAHPPAVAVHAAEEDHDG